MQTTDARAPNWLGFVVKVVGRNGLKPHGALRRQSAPQLRVSLSYLEAIFDYPTATDIHMHSMASGLAPYITKLDLPAQQRQIESLRSGDMPAENAARRCLATWPSGQRPKLHFLTATGALRPGMSAPHADYTDAAADIMLEAKMKDVALPCLRADPRAAGLGYAFR